MNKEIGFDERKSPIVQLKDLLNISNEQYVLIKHTISSLTSTSLDVGSKGNDQIKKLSGIEETLQRMFPDIFDSPRKLAFVRKVSLQFHRNARRRVIRNTANCVNQATPYPSRRHEPIAVMGSDHRDGSKAAQPLKREGPHFGPLFSSNSLASSTVAGHGAAPTATAGPVSSCQTNPSGPSSTAPSGSAVSSFLQQTAPSMEHLLSRFFALGFHSISMVQAVADKWTAEERRDLLKRLTSSSNGKGVSELELAALERAFRALHSKSTV